MRKLGFILLLLMFMACGLAKGQSTVTFNLRDPQWGISQATNALVTIQLWGYGSSGQQVLLPFRLQQYTDVNGDTAFTNLFGGTNTGVYNFVIAPYQSAQRISGNFWVSSTNLGVVSEPYIDVIQNPAPFPYQFPWSYSAMASDLRYGPSTNLISGYVTTAQLSNATNLVYQAIPSTNGFVGSGITNGLAMTSQLPPITNGFNLSIVTSNPASYATPQLVTNAILALANTNPVALSDVTNVANNIYSNNPAGYVPTNVFTTGTNAVWTNSTAQTTQATNVLAQNVNTALTAGTNAAYSGAILAIQGTNAALLGYITLSTNGLNGVINVVSNLLANTKQPGSVTLTNLAGTGAVTNMLLAGQNFSLTTNGSGTVVFLNATNQAFLTNGMTSIVFTQPTAYLASSLLPGLTNGFLMTPATNGLASQAYVLALISSLPTFTNALAAGQNFSLSTNMSGNTVFLNATNQNFLTNGMTSIVFLQPSAFLSASLLPGLTNGFLTASATNGLATVLYVNSSLSNSLSANTNFYSLATNNAATNLTAKLSALPAALTNYVASTNGYGFNPSFGGVIYMNGLTNFNAGKTDLIVIATGPYAGQYTNAGSQWLNWQNTNEFFTFSGGTFLLGTNYGGIAQGLYFWNQGQMPGFGTPLFSFSTPPPYAGFGTHMDATRFILHGFVASTNLSAQQASAILAGVVPGYGLTNSQIGNWSIGYSNVLSLNSNSIIQLIYQYSTAPTNGLGTNSFFYLLNQWTITNQTVAAPVITNVLYTNLISGQPVIMGNTVFIETNALSGAGGQATNAIGNLNGIGTNTTIVANLNATNITVNGGQNIVIGGYTPFNSQSANNVSIASTNVFFGNSSSGTAGNTVLSGRFVTNNNQSSVTIGSYIYNPWSSCIVFNESGNPVATTAYNEIMLYGGSGGILFNTNASGGYALNLNGAANFTSLNENGVPVATNATQSPWLSDINAGNFNLTNISGVYGSSPDNGVFYGMSISGGFFQYGALDNPNSILSIKPSGELDLLDSSEDTVLHVSRNLTGPVGSTIDVSGGTLVFGSDVLADNQQIGSDGQGDWFANLLEANGGVTSTNVSVPLNFQYPAGSTQAVLNGSSFLSTVPLVVPSANVSGNVNAGGYYLNGVPLNFTLNGSGSNILVTSIWVTNAVGTATNFNGVYLMNNVSNFWTNTVTHWELLPQTWLATNFSFLGNLASIEGSAMMVTNTATFEASGDGSGIIPFFFYPGGTLFGTYSFFNYNGTYSYGSVQCQPIASILSYIQIPNPSITITSSNSTVGIGLATNANGTVNYNLSVTGGGGSATNVDFISSSTINWGVVNGSNQFSVVPNSFDAYGTATNTVNYATNLLGSAAYQNSSAFDANGAASAVNTALRAFTNQPTLSNNAATATYATTAGNATNLNGLAASEYQLITNTVAQMPSIEILTTNSMRITNGPTLYFPDATTMAQNIATNPVWTTFTNQSYIIFGTNAMHPIGGTIIFDCALSVNTNMIFPSSSNWIQAWTLEGRDNIHDFINFTCTNSPVEGLMHFGVFATNSSTLWCENMQFNCFNLGFYAADGGQNNDIVYADGCLKAQIVNCREAVDQVLVTSWTRAWSGTYGPPQHISGFRIQGYTDNGLVFDNNFMQGGRYGLICDMDHLVAVNNDFGAYQYASSPNYTNAAGVLDRSRLASVIGANHVENCDSGFICTNSIYGGLGIIVIAPGNYGDTGDGNLFTIESPCTCLNYGTFDVNSGAGLVNLGGASVVSINPDASGIINGHALQLNSGGEVDTSSNVLDDGLGNFFFSSGVKSLLQVTNFNAFGTYAIAGTVPANLGAYQWIYAGTNDGLALPMFTNSSTFPTNVDILFSAAVPDPWNNKATHCIIPTNATTSFAVLAAYFGSASMYAYEPNSGNGSTNVSIGTWNDVFGNYTGYFHATNYYTSAIAITPNGISLNSPNLAITNAGIYYGNGQAVTNQNVSTFASGNTSTSNNWTGEFSGNGGALTNVSTNGIVAPGVTAGYVLTATGNGGTVMAPALASSGSTNPATASAGTFTVTTNTALFNNATLNGANLLTNGAVIPANNTFLVGQQFTNSGTLPAGTNFFTLFGTNGTGACGVYSLPLASSEPFTPFIITLRLGYATSVALITNGGTAFTVPGVGLVTYYYLQGSTNYQSLATCAPNDKVTTNSWGPQ